jgi:hypothetical protein
MESISSLRLTVAILQREERILHRWTAGKAAW